MIRLKTMVYFVSVLGMGYLIAGCKKDKNEDNFDTSGTYTQKDQMGRPGISTVFIGASQKDQFNLTIPTAQSATYKPTIVTGLTNFGYVTNILGLNKDAFAGVLATDVLNVKTSGTTTFYDGTNVLTGRALADDVIDVELTLIFGGATGASNPGLNTDHVSANDKAFLASFPYLASPW
jgi:hypothetical protein